MKSVVLILSLIAITASAQTETCNQIQLEKEVNQYITTKENTGIRFIGNCLARAIRVISITNKNELMTEEQIVFALRDGIEQDKLAAQVKGEVFEQSLVDEDLSILDQEADLKRANPLEGINE